MAGNRAFKGLASLRAGFDQPFEDEAQDSPIPVIERVQAVPVEPLRMAPVAMPEPRGFVPSQHGPQPVAAVSPITGKVDRRRLRKVLKTPSVSLSVAVRSELHEEVSALLFARKTTWIAVLDELLTGYVAEAKTAGRLSR